MNRFTFAILAVLLAAAGLVHGQAVYKYQTPDGRIVYSSEAVPGAKLLGTVREPLPQQPVDGQRQERMKRERDAVNQSSSQRLNALNAADADIKAASAALAEARARQAAGVEPLEGERVGTVRGGGEGRPRDIYLDRQKQLQDAVDEAQRRLDRAYEARNAAR
jgi:Domain of unknown function (DUF4124)